MLAIFASRCLNDNPPLIFEDGKQRRDFVSVRDVARACRLALTTPNVGEVFNIGSGEPRSVLEVARSSAMAGEPITIYSDGKQVRDVLFVEDLVDAFALARRNIGKLSGRAFNIGGGPGNTVSLLELIRRLEELLARRVDLSFDAWRVGDQRYYVSDTSKLGATTGWRAKTDVEQGLLALCDWKALIADSAKRAALAAAARRRAAEYGVNSMAAAYAQVYRSLAAGQSSGARAVA